MIPKYSQYMEKYKSCSKPPTRCSFISQYHPLYSTFSFHYRSTIKHYLTTINHHFDPLLITTIGKNMKKLFQTTNRWCIIFTTLDVFVIRCIPVFPAELHLLELGEDGEAGRNQGLAAKMLSCWTSGVNSSFKVVEYMAKCDISGNGNTLQW